MTQDGPTGRQDRQWVHVEGGHLDPRPKPGRKGQVRVSSGQPPWPSFSSASSCHSGSWAGGRDRRGWAGRACVREMRELCPKEAGRRRTVAGALLEGRPAPAPRRAGEGGSGCTACPALLRGTSSTSGGPGAGTEGSAEAGVSPVGEDLVTEQSSPGKAGAAGRQGAAQGKWRDPRLCLGWVS